MSLALILGAYEITDDEDDTAGEIEGDEKDAVYFCEGDPLNQVTGANKSTSLSSDCVPPKDVPTYSNEEIVNPPPPPNKVTQKRRRGRQPRKRKFNHLKKSDTHRYRTRATTSNNSRQIAITDETPSNNSGNMSSKYPESGKDLRQLGTAFPCPHCPETFLEPDGLIAHLPFHNEMNSFADSSESETNEGGQGASFPCPFCAATFAEPEGLITHLPVHTMEEPACKNTEDGNKTELKQSTSSCNQRDKSIPSLKHLEIKLTRCDAAPDTPDLSRNGRPVVGKRNRMNQGMSPRSTQKAMCEKELDTRPTTIIKITQKNGRTGWKCSICEKITAHRSSASIHLRVHTGNKPHQCPTCLKCFVSLGNLNQHVWTHTNKERPWNCSICPKGFINRSRLRDHMLIHTGTGKKAHACPFCSKRFAYFSILTAHVRLHTGDKPYVCSLCPKRFTRGHTLKAHLLNAHPTGEPSK